MNKGYFDRSDEAWVIPINDKFNKPIYLKREGTARDKNNRKLKHKLHIHKVVWGQDTRDPKKVIIIQEFSQDDDIESEVRLGDYIFDRDGHWSWGQYALMVPKEDLKELYAYAHEKGMI